jgi:hypothetical protein
MPAYARSHIVPPDEVGVNHCMARCVRRAFLHGVDPLTNHDCDYRKEWIRERLELLASVFAIDICAADPARQVSVTSRLDRSTASGGQSRGDPESARANSGATGNRRRRLDRDSAAIRSPVQHSRRPTQCAGGPRRTQRLGLAPGQQRRCPGLSIAGRSVTERARPTGGQHALHRKATPRCPGLGAKRLVGRALSRPWYARADRSRREARRSWLRMPMVASRPRSANAVANQTPE